MKLSEFDGTLYETLTEAVARRLPKPYFVVVLGRTGTLALFKLDAELELLEVRKLREGAPDDGNFVLPINVMLVDASGHGEAFVLERDAPRFTLIQGGEHG